MASQKSHRLNKSSEAVLVHGIDEFHLVIGKTKYECVHNLVRNKIMWIVKRLLGLLLMLGGIAFLAKSVVITTKGFMINTPAVMVCSAGILILVYGREIRNLGWGVILNVLNVSFSMYRRRLCITTYTRSKPQGYLFLLLRI